MSGETSAAPIKLSASAFCVYLLYSLRALTVISAVQVRCVLSELELVIPTFLVSARLRTEKTSKVRSWHAV